MTPDYPFRNTAGGHAEAPKSAARLAAEAFFAPAPVPPPDDQVTADIQVKKSRLPVAQADAVSQASDPVDQARAPRVFRRELPQPRADQEAEAEPRTSPEAPPLPGADGGEDSMPGAVAVKRAPRLRRTRKVLHGEVKVIRPQEAATPAPVPAAEPEALPMPSTDAVSPVTARSRAARKVRPVESQAGASIASVGNKALPVVEVTAAPAPETTKPLSEPAKRLAARPARAAAQRGNAPKAPPQTDQYDWPRYPLMLAELRELAIEAEQARQREAAAAIIWIKQAITTYALSAQDLGLR